MASTFHDLQRRIYDLDAFTAAVVVSLASRLLSLCTDTQTRKHLSRSTYMRPTAKSGPLGLASPCGPGRGRSCTIWDCTTNWRALRRDPRVALMTADPQN